MQFAKVYACEKNFSGPFAKVHAREKQKFREFFSSRKFLFAKVSAPKVYCILVPGAISKVNLVPHDFAGNFYLI